MDKEPEASGLSGLSEIFDIIHNIENPPERNCAIVGDITPKINQLDNKSPSIEKIQQHLLEDNFIDHSTTAGRSIKSNTGAVSKKPKPYIKIVEQPAPASQRYRYICEARTAGSIQGVNYTPENKTFPTVEVVGWKGEVKLLVSLVTKDEPYKAHPHNLVGKDDNYKDGIFIKILKDGQYRVVLSNLGVQCVKRKDIKDALDKRERYMVDPFKQKFAHKDQPGSIDLSSVRLCFQAYIVLPDGGLKPLTPVVSDPIYDKKSVNGLVICRMCRCSGVVTGGENIILLCEKVSKEDIQIRFFEEDDNRTVVWEGFGEFTPNDVHKNTAIAFKTPRYNKDEVDKNSKFFIQLVRPSNGETSVALPFEYYPNSVNIVRKRKTEPETPAFFLKREILRQDGMLSRPSPLTDIYSNYGNTWNNLDNIKAEPSSLSPNINQMLTPSPVFSPNHLTPTPELQNRWTPSPGSQLPYRINTLSIGEQTCTGNYINTPPNLQIQQQQQLQQQLQQQQQIQQQQLQQQHQQQQQLLLQQQQQQQQQQFGQLFAPQPFSFTNNISPPNNNNFNRPTNLFLSPLSPLSPLRNSTSGGSITPLLPTNFGQNNNNTQQSIQSLQLNHHGLSPETQQSLPVSPISPQEQYTLQQSPQPNMNTVIPNHQVQLPEPIEIDSSEEPLTTSGLIRLITSDEFLMK